MLINFHGVETAMIIMMVQNIENPKKNHIVLLESLFISISLCISIHIASFFKLIQSSIVCGIKE